jgi:hypothetical protein
LKEIDPSVQERPEGELPGQGRPGSPPDGQPDDFLQDDRASVKVKLGDVLSREGAGRPKMEKESFVEGPAVGRIDDLA